MLCCVVLCCVVLCCVVLCCVVVCCVVLCCVVLCCVVLCCVVLCCVVCVVCKQCCGYMCTEKKTCIKEERSSKSTSQPARQPGSQQAGGGLRAWGPPSLAARTTGSSVRGHLTSFVRPGLGFLKRRSHGTSRRRCTSCTTASAATSSAVRSVVNHRENVCVCVCGGEGRVRRLPLEAGRHAPLSRGSSAEGACCG